MSGHGPIRNALSCRAGWSIYACNDRAMAEGVTRLGAFAVVLDRGGRLLLVRQVRSARWTLPGGGVHFGESPLEAVTREVLEETGFRVVVTGLLGTHDNVYTPDDGVRRHGVRLLYLAELERRSAWAPDDEIAEVAWFRLDELPSEATPWVHAARDLLPRSASGATPADIRARPLLAE